jgi:hypothetical protein
MKDKQCSQCPHVGPLWKSRPPLCANCARKHQKPVNKISEKRVVKNKKYKEENVKFLKANPLCQLKLLGCTELSTEVHHLYSGRNRDKYYLDTTTWKASCSSCHHYLHDVLSAKQAEDLGLKKTE